jgi:hypothetical protein
MDKLVRQPKHKLLEEHKRFEKKVTHEVKKPVVKETHLRRKEMIKELNPKLTRDEIKEELRKRRKKPDVEVFERGTRKK